MKDAEAKTATVVGEVLNRTMPSTIARAAYDATTGDKSFVGSMVEGNEGLGNSALNFVFDIAAPIGITKGFKYAWEALPKKPVIDMSRNIDLSHLNVGELMSSTASSSQLLYNLKTGKIGLKELTDMVG